MNIGVRSSSSALHSKLRRALSQHLVESVEARPNYSVRLAEDPGTFHHLYWGGVTALRSLDPARLLSGLFTHLSSHSSPHPGMFRVRGLVLIRHGVALLAPQRLHSGMAKMQPFLMRHGLAVVDAPWVDVDLGTGEVVIPAPDLAADHVAIREILAAAPPGRREPVVAPGRYPIAGWCFSARHEGNIPMGRAESTMRAIACSPIRVPAEHLESVGRLFATVPSHLLVAEASPRSIADHFDSLASAY